ncbi:MAG TPA: LuxR C-terminal-related transcriptional regulator [Steroidobacteraceae bacterium]|jgi:LuxR family maltose regulon positive regulatory protein
MHATEFSSVGAYDRFHPPLYRVELLPRTELRRRLDVALRYPLTAIAAPAGYGKSSVLAQWRSDLLENGTEVAWLSIVDESTDAQTLVGDLILAITRAGRSLGRLAGLAEDGLADLATGSVVDRLMQALAREIRPLVLIIDDVHRVSPAAFATVLGPLLRAPLDAMHIVLSGRDPPPLNVPELEGRGLLVRLDAAEFRFSRDEARELLAGFEPAQAQRLAEQSEGWPIVLQLLRSWLQTHPASALAPDALSGSVDGIVSYLTEQVLANLSDREAALLRDVSILDAFNPDLVTAVTGNADAWSKVIGARAFEYLIVPLDQQRYWLRYHHLIGEILRRRLRDQPLEEVAALHRRASQWFEAHGMPAEAVRHASAAGDFKHAAQVVARQGIWELTQYGGVSLLRRLLAPIPLERAREYPRVQLGRTILLAKSSRPLEALQLFKATEEATAGFSRLPPDEIEATKRDARLVYHVVAGYCDLPLGPDTLAGVHRLIEELPASESVARAVLLNVAAFYAHSLGGMPTALDLANQGVRAMRHLGSVVGINHCYLHVGTAHLRLGQLRDAEAAFQEASALAEENFGADSGLRACSDVMLAVAFYARGDIDGARERLGPALAQVEAGDGWIDVYLEGYETAAAIAFIDGGQHAVDDVLMRMERTARERGLRRLAALRETLVARLAILRGDYPGAEAALARLSPPYRLGRWREHPFWWRVDDEAALAAALLALAREDLTGAEAALNDLSQAARAGQREAPLTLARTLLAVLHLRRGDAAGASQALLEVIEARMAEEDVESIARLGAVIAPLLRTVRTRIQASESTTSIRVRHALSALSSAVERFRVGDRGSPLPLSPRETEVLAALARGASNKVIARTLQMTANTVKFHLKSIFNKLGVSSRADAIELARQHDL